MRSSSLLRHHLAAATLLVLAICEPTAALSPVPRATLKASLTAQPSKPVIPGFRSLLFSQCLSSWGDRCWEFAAPFFLLTLQPNSLGPIAAQGLIVYASTVLAAPAIGSFVDSAPRLQAARSALVVQNSLVASCALVAAFVLPGGGAGGIVTSEALRWAAAVAFSVGCAGASCASLANSLSVSKDWVVVLASTSSGAEAAPSTTEATQERLAHANAALRKVDLVAKVGAPALMGMLLAVTSQRVAALLLAAWNVVSAVLEAALLTKVHQANRPALLAAKARPPNKAAEAQRRMRSHAVYGVYGVQRAARAGLALSLLYLSALTFGALMSAFLHTQGMSTAAIGRGRAAAGLTSLLGAAIFPWVRRRLGTEGAGRAGVLLQLTALTPAVVSLCLGGGGRGVVSLVPLVCGVIVSRAGLWLFDLSVSQIFQESVEPAGAIQPLELLNPKVPEDSPFSLPSEPPRFPRTLHSAFPSRLRVEPAQPNPSEPPAQSSPIIVQSPQAHCHPLEGSSCAARVLLTDRGAVGAALEARHACAQGLSYLSAVALPRPDQFGVHVVASFAATALAAVVFETYLRKERSLPRSESHAA